MAFSRHFSHVEEKLQKKPQLGKLSWPGTEPRPTRWEARCYPSITVVVWYSKCWAIFEHIHLWNWDICHTMGPTSVSLCCRSLPPGIGTTVWLLSLPLCHSENAESDQTGISWGVRKGGNLWAQGPGHRLDDQTPPSWTPAGDVLVWPNFIVQRNNIATKHPALLVTAVTISSLFCPRTLCTSLSVPTKSAWISYCREIHCHANALTAAWFLG